MYQHEIIERHRRTNVIEAKTTTKIAYMNNPPNEGGEIQYLTLDAFKEKFHCEYTEGIVIKNQHQKILEEKDFKSTKAKAAYERSGRDSGPKGTNLYFWL